MKLIKEAKDYSIKHLEEQFNKLEYYCSKYPEIDVFVSTILELVNAGVDNRKYTEEQELACAICDLLEEFGLSNLKSTLAYNDSQSFWGNWIQNLNNFIGYHLLDDGSLVFRRDGICKKWKIYSYDGVSDEYTTQNALAIVAAAKDNMIFEKELRGWEKGVEIVYHRGMIPTGKVEQYIFQANDYYD